MRSRKVRFLSEWSPPRPPAAALGRWADRPTDREGDIERKTSPTFESGTWGNERTTTTGLGGEGKERGSVGIWEFSPPRNPTAVAIPPLHSLQASQNFCHCGLGAAKGKQPKFQQQPLPAAKPLGPRTVRVVGGGGEQLA